MLSIPSRCSKAVPLVRWPLAAALTLGLASAVAGQSLGPAQPFPGDDAVGISVETQGEVAIAAGGPGYLAVWEDERPNLAGVTNSPGALGAGNMIDIYGARFDAQGQLIDTTPIVITNEGQNQTDPVVAWNGTHWLVVWVTQRPDWYFFSDIVGVRVAADGTVLDSTPIMIRPETNSPSNNYGENPSVASDGNNWLVVWEAIDFSDNKQIVQGARVAGDGTVLDPNYVTLYKFTSLVFGPEFPQAASLNGEYLVTWDNFGPVFARRFDGNLNPLGEATRVPGLLGNVRVAAGIDSYLILATLKAGRVAADGTSLDPTPIEIPNAAPVFTQSATVKWPELAWTGANWAVTYSIPETGSLFDDADIWLVRVGTSGSVLDPQPINVDASADDDQTPMVAGGGAGDMLIAYPSRGSVAQRYDDVHATHVAANGTPGTTQAVSLGLTRQESLSWVRGNGVHLALYTSKSSGVAQILAQRFDDSGVAIDTQPVVVHQGPETPPYAASGAWNGSIYLVTWLDVSGLVLSRRLSPTLQVLGFGATPLMQGMDGAPDVGALGNDFLVAVSDLFSGDQRNIKGIRVDGNTGGPIEASPFLIGFNYSFDPEVVGFGGRWFVAWTARACHDCSSDRVRGRFVSAGGVPQGSNFVINGPGQGVGASITVAGDRALVAYADVSSFLQDAIEARLVMSDGTFIGNEIAIADPVGRQTSPSAGFDGTGFVVSWSDYRSTLGVEQPRADVYAARLAFDGTVLDPDGFPIATGVLPEDFPAVSSGSSRTLLGYLALNGVGGVPEVQRIHMRTLDSDVTCQQDLGFGGPGTARLSVCGDALVGTGQADLLLDSDQPSALALIALGSSLNPTSMFGGTLVPMPPQRVLVRTTDANGDVSMLGLSGTGTPFTFYLQAVVADAAQPGGFQISNAVRIEHTP